ncbi:hypothetical protein SBBP2_610022 [Burkholderiales bacterium]|nr:hypothetical protein SBBP2_610022 [Burkholderiales bacterium]
MPGLRPGARRIAPLLALANTRFGLCSFGLDLCDDLHAGIRTRLVRQDDCGGPCEGIDVEGDGKHDRYSQGHDEPSVVEAKVAAAFSHWDPLLLMDWVFHQLPGTKLPARSHQWSRSARVHSVEERRYRSVGASTASQSHMALPKSHVIVLTSLRRCQPMR